MLLGRPPEAIHDFAIGSPGSRLLIATVRRMCVPPAIRKPRGIANAYGWSRTATPTSNSPATLGARQFTADVASLSRRWVAPACEMTTSPTRSFSEPTRPCTGPSGVAAKASRWMGATTETANAVGR